MNPFIRRILIAIVILCIIAGGALAYVLFSSGVPLTLKDRYVQIPTGSSFEDVVKILDNQGVLQNERLFRVLSERMSYKREPMRAGRYEVKPGWSVITLIRHLRNGEQTPVKVVLTTERMVENVAAKAARFIEPDSVTMLRYMQDESYLQNIGYTRDNLMSVFIPNTYEFYWNTTPEAFMKRMIKEHDAFWAKNNRLQKAEALGLTPAEVYTLASIVERETNANSEKPRMAGVYLNRLRIGMRLQADPTAVFATRDFETPRVTNYHIFFDSPYNTYLYAGLPPGPITMASISSIDGVLNAEKHDYLYFCATGEPDGLHAFAATLEEHNQNVRRYVETLKRRGLR
ncbi:MAG: endolytic transglycosylase MltG [Saprospiraceae bacterium]